MPNQASELTQTTETVNPGTTASWGFLNPIPECRAFSIVSTGLVGVRVNNLDKPEMSVLIGPNDQRIIELDPDIELRSVHVSNQTDGPVTFTIRLICPIEKPIVHSKRP